MLFLTGCLEGLALVKRDQFIDLYVELHTGNEKIVFDEVIYCNQDVKWDAGAGWTDRWITIPEVFEKDDDLGNRWMLYSPIRCEKEAMDGYPFKLLKKNKDGTINIFILSQMPESAVSTRVIMGIEPIKKKSASRHLKYSQIASRHNQIFSIFMRITDVDDIEMAWISEYLREKNGEGQSYVFIGSSHKGAISIENERYANKGNDLSFVVRDESLSKAVMRSKGSYVAHDCQISYLRKDGKFWRSTNDMDRVPVDAAYGDINDALVMFGGRVIPAARPIIVYDVKNQKKIQFGWRDTWWFSKRWFNYDATYCEINLRPGLGEKGTGAIMFAIKRR